MHVELDTANLPNRDGVVRYTEPLMRENKKDDFKKVDWDTAIEKTAEILVNAKRPILYGFSATECHAHAYGMKLAEMVGGVVSNTAEVCHGPSVWQEYWGCNSMHAHPRHMGRYGVFARGFFRERGRSNRTLIVVDPRKTDTAKLADIHLQVWVT